MACSQQPRAGAVLLDAFALTRQRRRQPGGGSPAGVHGRRLVPFECSSGHARHAAAAVAAAMRVGDGAIAWVRFGRRRRRQGRLCPPAPPPQPRTPFASHRAPFSRPRLLSPAFRPSRGELACWRLKPFLSKQRARTAYLLRQHTSLRRPRSLLKSCLFCPPPRLNQVRPPPPGRPYIQNENRADRGLRRDFSSTCPHLLKEHFCRSSSPLGFAVQSQPPWPHAGGIASTTRAVAPLWRGLPEAG